jgi:hypothetical protein
MKTKRTKTRDDLEGFGKHEPYIPRNKWEYDAIDGALRPLDEVASSLEVKWGRDRLIALVSPETASKFKTAKAKLDAAIAYNNPTDVIKRVNIMIRGWQALEKEATQAGHKAFPPDVWVASVGAEGKHEACEFAIVKDSADASMVKDAGMNIYSLVEIARMVRLFELKVDSVSNIKKLFPDSEITKVEFKEDELPF